MDTVKCTVQPEITIARRSLLKGAAAFIFAHAAVPALAQSARSRITLQEYCTRQKAILNRDPASFAQFVADYTPFRDGAIARTSFQSAHGAITISAPAETFIAFGNPNLDQWGKNDVRLVETGGTLAAIHSSLGTYTRNDPSDIQRLSRLAAQDISIGSRYTAPMIEHMASRHGIHLKNSNQDSSEFASLKENALEGLIL